MDPGRNPGSRPDGPHLKGMMGMPQMPWGQGPPPFMKMSLHLSKPSEGQKKVELKDQYDAVEYFTAPESQHELLHKYSVLKRSLFGQDPKVEDPNSKSLLYYGYEFVKGVQDFRLTIVQNLDLKTRFYLGHALWITFTLFSRKKIRRIIPYYFLSHFWVCPENIKAILRAN